MPVHRHLHDKLGSVYALKTELDAWARSRARTPTGEHEANDTLWRNPLANAEFTPVTNFEGTQQAAAISRDGKFVAFLSDRDGRTDVWITQIGAGAFYNLTRGAAVDVVNPDVRVLSFSPDGTLVLFWVRTSGGSTAGQVSTWAIPTLGGRPRPHFDFVEFDWSESGRLVYHTSDPGDPMFVTAPNQSPPGRQIFVGTPGQHAHFPVWSPDEAFIYFVGGIVPSDTDLWRVRPDGGGAERVTFHHARVAYPVFVDSRTLLYLAGGIDGSGPWLYAFDITRRASQRIGSGVDQYSSLAVTGERRRLVATRSNPKVAFWRSALSDTPATIATARRVGLTTGSGRSPRFGPGFLLYVSAKGTTDCLWKIADGAAAEVWTAPPDAQIVGGPAATADGTRIAACVNERERSRLYVMNADGTHARTVAESLDLRGTPAWAPDGRSLLVTAANQGGVPHIWNVPLDGRPPAPIVSEYSVDPAWAPDGSFFIYSGPDIGTAFRLKAMTAGGGEFDLPNIVLTRGARHLAFVGNRRAIVALNGEVGHKDVCLIDLRTGIRRPVTRFDHDVVIRDFDIAPDGSEIVIEQVQERSDIVRIDLPA